MREDFLFKWRCTCEKPLNDIGTHYEVSKFDETRNNFNDVKENQEYITSLELYDNDGQTIGYYPKDNCIRINKDNEYKIIVDDINICESTNVFAYKQAVAFIQDNSNTIIKYAIGFEDDKFKVSIIVDAQEGKLNLLVESKDEERHDLKFIEDNVVLCDSPFVKEIDLEFD